MDVLVSRYHGKLIEFALRHLRHRDAAADVAQAALVKAFTSAAAFRHQSSFKSWLYAIALNLVRDRARRQKRKPEMLFADLSYGGEEPEWGDAGSARCGDGVFGQAATIALWQAVEGLSEQQRTAVILRFRSDLTYDEIADAMGAPVGTTRSWVHHALKALRKSLNGEEETCAAKNTNRA